jgi:hypothetical protein
MQTVRYYVGIPRKSLPEGCVLLHNFPPGDPQRSPNAGGFRIFVARVEPGDKLPPPCKCGWSWKGGHDPHYNSWDVKRADAKPKKAAAKPAVMMAANKAVSKPAAKKPAAPPVPDGDIQAQVAFQLISACKKHLKGNDIPRIVPKAWVDSSLPNPDFGVVLPSVSGERELWLDVRVGQRRRLYVTVRPAVIQLRYGDRLPQLNVNFDLNDPNFERDIAEFIGKHFKCYFPTYWMTGGEK